MNIGLKIKGLRKKQDVTQEKLAAYLNISYQAISKWENGTAYPDITLIPPIANFFGVTADELLGMKDVEENKELKKYEKKYFDLRRQGKILKSIEVAREVLKIHPRNFQWMINLCESLTSYSFNEEQRAYSKEHNFLEEAVSICERILEDCTTDSIRHSAIHILCFSYPKINKIDKAVRLANEMPNLFACKEYLLTHIYEGEDRIKACQQLLMLITDQVCGLIWTLISDELMGNELTSNQRIELSQKAISLLDLLFYEDKDNGFWTSVKERIYERMAKIYAKENDADNLIKTLLLAEKNAIISDESLTQNERNYNSLLVNRLTYYPKNYMTNFEGTQREFLLMTINNDKSISQFKELPEIEELIERLKIN